METDEKGSNSSPLLPSLFPHRPLFSFSFTFMLETFNVLSSFLTNAHNAHKKLSQRQCVSHNACSSLSQFHVKYGSRFLTCLSWFCLFDFCTCTHNRGPDEVLNPFGVFVQSPSLGMSRLRSVLGQAVWNGCVLLEALPGDTEKNK